MPSLVEGGARRAPSRERATRALHPEARGARRAHAARAGRRPHPAAAAAVAARGAPRRLLTTALAFPIRVASRRVCRNDPEGAQPSESIRSGEREPCAVAEASALATASRRCANVPGGLARASQPRIRNEQGSSGCELTAARERTVSHASGQYRTAAGAESEGRPSRSFRPRVALLASLVVSSVGSYSDKKPPFWGLRQLPQRALTTALSQWVHITYPVLARPIVVDRGLWGGRRPCRCTQPGWREGGQAVLPTVAPATLDSRGDRVEHHLTRVWLPLPQL